MSETLGIPSGAVEPVLVPEPDESARASGPVWKRWLEWSATSVPIALLLATGLVCGPSGVNLLSRGLLSSMDFAVPVAIAALGVSAGLGIGDRLWVDRSLMPAAMLGAVTSLLVVSTAFALLVFTQVLSPANDWTLVVALGVCAASSLNLPVSPASDLRSATAALTTLGVIVPVLVGGFLLARQQTGSSGDALLLMGTAAGITVILAAAAWLLLVRISSDTEERVITVAALLLVGGVGAALSLSALFSGVVAGLCWWRASGPPRASIARTVLFVQHPLAVLILLFAGARAGMSVTSLGLGAAYVVLRLLAQRAAGSAAGRTARGIPRDATRHFISPGVFGIAFALDADGGSGAGSSLLLGAVTAGTIGSDLLARFLVPRNADL
jgi:hypothetical protein